jgi:hypothetical protein
MHSLILKNKKLFFGTKIKSLVSVTKLFLLVKFLNHIKFFKNNIKKKGKSRRNFVAQNLIKNH